MQVRVQKEGSFAEDDDRVQALDSIWSVTAHPVPHTHAKLKARDNTGVSTRSEENLLVFHGLDQNEIRVVP